MDDTDDEKILLKTAKRKSSSSTIDPMTIGEAIERVGCGFGSVLYSFGPYGYLIMAGAEVAIMSIVSLILKCEWSLSTFWTSITQVTGLIACAIFSILLSHLGDRYGRRLILIIATVVMLISGILSGIARNLWEFLICRTAVGFSEGIGVGPAAAFSAEIATVKFRSVSLSSVGIGWGFGTTLSSGLAYFTLNPLGWRGYLITIALLCLPLLILLLIIKESPRYDVKIGKLEKSKATLKRLSALNCTSKEMEEVEIAEDPNSEGLEIATFVQSYQILKTTGYLSDFWKLLAITLFGELVYMGFLYAAPHYVNRGHCNVLHVQHKKSCSFDDSVLFDLGIIGLADPICIAVGLLLVDRIGRKMLLLVSTIIPVFVLIPLYFCIPSTLMLIVQIVARGHLAVMGWLIFVISSEYFPTSVRSFTTSMVSGFYSLASVISSFFVQYAFDVSPSLVTSIMQISLVVTSVLTYSIKREMTGKQLEQ